MENKEEYTMNNYNKKRFFALFITTLVLAVSFVFGTVCYGLSLSYNAGSVYKKSYYHSMATAIELTGDQRYDIMSIALSQLGYHSGDGEDEMHGENVLGTKSFAEFNRIYGKVDNEQGNGESYGYYWCCCFVSWCMRQAGVSKSIVPTKCASRKIISALEEDGNYRDSSSGYIPKCSDMIFFGDADSIYATHIGFVVTVKDRTVYTIEGNGNNHVVARSYDLSDPYILGFSCIDYEQIDGMKYDFAYAVNEEIYLPLLTLQDTNVYSAPGKENELIYTYKSGQKIEPITFSGCWAKVSTPNGDGWLDSDLCEPIVPDIAYAVKFYLCGGTGGALDKISYEGEEIKLSSTAPIRTGYTFKGWAEEPDGKVKYQPGDTYKGKKGDSLKRLFAIWEPEVCTVTYLNDDGSVLLEKQVPYGSKTPQAKAPTKPSDDEYSYKFRGWSPAPAPIVFGDMTYTPTFKSTEIPVETTAPETKAPETTKSPETTKIPETTVQAQQETEAIPTENQTERETVAEDTVISESDTLSPLESLAPETQTDAFDSSSEITNAPTEQEKQTSDDSVQSTTPSSQTNSDADENGSSKSTAPMVIISIIVILALASGVVFVILKKKKAA